jgi:hypothetical protein
MLAAESHVAIVMAVEVAVSAQLAPELSELKHVYPLNGH